MSEQYTLTLLHSIAWPTILALLTRLRARKSEPSELARHIWWFNNRPTWILYRFGPKGA
jgi:hypothetical protein